jgi:uracil-DNA glycosylase family 4
MAVSRKSDQARLMALQSSMLGCARCAALVGCRSRVVPGAGTIGAAVAFVGIAPGRLGGDRTGIPFSGDRSGNLLREMIAKSGLREVFVTNLVRCNPRDPQGRNRDPDADEIANCREHLEAELTLVGPKVVACLGRMAWLHLAGKKAAFDPEHGVAIKTDRWLLYPMYHPAYVNRGAYSRWRYASDFRRLRLALRRRAPS